MSCNEGGGENEYPIEFLNTLDVAGLPLAQLALKLGCPLMLLRNIDTTNGLCNRTRMILMAIKPRVLQCRVLGGKFAGRVVFIPRITIKPSNEDLPIPFTRHQFPVRLSTSLKDSRFGMSDWTCALRCFPMASYMSPYPAVHQEIESKSYF